MGSYNSHGTKGEMTVDGRMDGTALASFLSLAPSFCMVCMQLHSLHEPSWPACLSQSFNAVLRMGMAAQHSLAQQAEVQITLCMQVWLSLSLDGRTAGMGCRHSLATPYRVRRGEDLPPGSRGLFELSTSPSDPLPRPVKAPVKHVATTPLRPLRTHMYVYRLVYS